MSIASINTSYQGIQRGMQSLDRAAQQTASASVAGSEGFESLVEAALEAKKAEIQVKASAEMMKTEHDVQGSLLDTFA